MPASGVIPISPSSAFIPPVVSLRLRVSSSAFWYSWSWARRRSSSSRSCAACSAYHTGSWVFTYGAGADGEVSCSSSVRPTMEIRPRLWSCSRLSFVQTTGFRRSDPARGLFAARRGMARVERVMEIASENVRWRFISLPSVFRRRGGRKMLEHFVYALVEVLGVLVGLVGERIARRASPDHFLCFCIEEIDYQGSHFVGLDGRGGIAKSTAESPTATSAEAVIERVQGLLILSRLNGKDLDVTSRGNFGPTFCRQSAVYCALDAVHQELVFRLDFFPRVGLVLTKVCAVVVVGLNVLSERDAR